MSVVRIPTAKVDLAIQGRTLIKILGGVGWGVGEYFFNKHICDNFLQSEKVRPCYYIGMI